MCQATVYLDGKEIMRDVMLVEPTPEGVRLVTLFEPVQVVSAVIRKIDLIKHLVLLESPGEGKDDHERAG
jgi:predicted RNA-binding protein